MPTLQYRFVNPDGDEYTQYRQTMQAGDALVEPQAPNDDGKVFSKWVAVVAPTEAVSSESTAFTDWRTITAADIPAPAEGEDYPIVRYVKAVFVQDREAIRITVPVGIYIEVPKEAFPAVISSVIHLLLMAC